jgi:hypothetical protein
VKRLSKASEGEIARASDILAKAAAGVITHDDEFKQACAWGSEILAHWPSLQLVIRGVATTEGMKLIEKELREVQP